MIEDGPVDRAGTPFWKLVKDIFSQTAGIVTGDPEERHSGR